MLNRLFVIFFRFGNLFGATPWMDLKHILFFHKHLLVLYMIAVITVVTTDCYYFPVYNRRTKNLVEWITSIITWTTSLITIINSYYNRAYWKKWMYTLKCVDKKLRTLNNNQQFETHKPIFSMIIFVTHLVNSTKQAIVGIVTGGDYGIALPSIYMRVSCKALQTFMWNILTIRFKLLNAALSAIHNSTIKRSIIKSEDIIQLKNIYRNLYAMSKYFIRIHEILLCCFVFDFLKIIIFFMFTIFNNIRQKNHNIFTVDESYGFSFYFLTFLVSKIFHIILMFMFVV